MSKKMDTTDLNKQRESLTEGKKKRHRTVESRTQKVAILESLGMKPADIAKSIPGYNKQTIYIDRKNAHKSGMVETLQNRMIDSTVNLNKERQLLAERCFEIANRKAKDILDKSDEVEIFEDGIERKKGIKLKDAEFALKAIGETEYSGRKQEAPVVNVNIRKDATLNIQQNLKEITNILGRSGLDLASLVDAT